MRKLIIGGLVVGGLFLAYKHTQKVDPVKLNALLQDAKDTKEETMAMLYVKMTKPEIEFFYDVRVLKKYGAILPESIKIQANSILNRLGVYPA